MKTKYWQLLGVFPLIIGVAVFYGSASQTKQAEAVLKKSASHLPLSPVEMLKQQLKQSPAQQTKEAKAAPGITLKILHRFTGPDGGFPMAGLNYVNNTFYGTTSAIGGRGPSQPGTVFKLSPAGQVLTTLHYFNRDDGSSPLARLTVDGAGNIYGTTSEDGLYYGGTIFKISPDGVFKTLFNFSGKDGSRSTSKLLLVGGYLYGTTYFGGQNSNGTIFRLSPRGQLKTLYRFNGKEGRNPYAGLIRDQDGVLYGTTVYGGANNKGSIFKLTAGGTLTTLHSFNSNDGSYPYAPLIQDSAGNLYGTTAFGGVGNSGTVFKLSLDGTFSTSHYFNGSDGATPYAPLIQDSAGNLYGTTSGGGRNGAGTIFQVAVDSTFTSLYQFGGLSGKKGGSRPNDVRLFKGALYGTTMITSAGACFNDIPDVDNCGTIFKLNISADASVRRHSRLPMLQSPLGEPND